jgi:hypothetical protein
VDFAADARARRSGLLFVLVVATAYTLLNAVKPLHVDDPFTWYVSKQILKAPLDPYGFEIFWFQWPQPCAEDLLAPVIAYWGALGLLLSGSSDFGWKLTLLPLALLFALSFHSLARRFAPGLEAPLTLMTLFSPLFLPSLNYMQDIPALALGLAALELYLRAEERDRLPLALAAGLLAGVAMQTKYTMFSIPGAMALHALLWRHWRPAIAAGLTALAVFLGWEAWTISVYGQGMFASNVRLSIWWHPRIQLVLPGLELLGAGLSSLALLALAAIGVRAAAVLGLALVVLAGHAALLWWPVEHELYLAQALVVVSSIVAVAVVRMRHGDALAGGRLARRRSDLFLLAWLALEVVSYFQISYFAAARRVLPFCVPATLLIGRAAALAPARRRIPVWPLVALQAALGLVTWGADTLEARAQRDTAREAHAMIRAEDPAAAIWFVGHWGFQYYAEKLGMRALVPDYSEVQRGDFVVVPSRTSQQAVTLDPAVFQPVRVHVDARWPPLWTSYGFYGGGTPLSHATGPRVKTVVYRAREATVPPSGWSVHQSADWAIRAGGRQAAWASRALVRALEQHPRAGARRLSAHALSVLGPRAPEAAPALERAAANDADPAVRKMAADALERVRGAPPAAAR